EPVTVRTCQSPSALPWIVATPPKDNGRGGRVCLLRRRAMEPVCQRALWPSEVAATLLLPLDGLEQCLEVALAEAQRAVPLDQLEEHRRPVAQRLGEDLEQVAVLVTVHQDAALLQLLDRHPDLADPCPQLRVLVVGVGGVEELDAVGPQRVDTGQDVPGGDGQVLCTGAAVELQIFVDLGLPLAHSR